MEIVNCSLLIRNLSHFRHVAHPAVHDEGRGVGGEDDLRVRVELSDEVDEPLAVDFKTDEMGIADSPDNERMEEKTKSPLGGLLRLFRRG